MIRNLLRSRKLPALVGIGAGVAGAVYAQHFYQTRIQAESLGTLDPDQWVQIPVKYNTPISHDTNEIAFDLPHDHTLGGKTAYCVLFKTMKDGKPVIRPYTPVSDPETLGQATFIIKAYPNGVMGNYVHGLKHGDGLEMKGPISKYPLSTNQHQQIALIGGGSGITPLFQILHQIANDVNDKTKVHLIYGSQTPDDILLKKEIDALAAKKPDTIQVTYFVDKAESRDEFPGNVGYITKDFLSKAIFDPTEDNVKVFVCGPPKMYDVISGNKKSPTDQGELTGALKELGFTKDKVFKF